MKIQYKAFLYLSEGEFFGGGRLDVMTSPIVALNGGLGNQLFQWYFAHTLESEKKFRIDCLFEASDTELGQREFRLE